MNEIGITALKYNYLDKYKHDNPTPEESKLSHLVSGALT